MGNELLDVKDRSQPDEQAEGALGQGFVVESHDAAALGARLVLQQNPEFAGCVPDDVVPHGRQVNMSGDSLKALLKPFASDEGIKQLRSALETMSFDGAGKAESRVTGQVRSKGLGLPTDPRI